MYTAFPSGQMDACDTKVSLPILPGCRVTSVWEWSPDWVPQTQMSLSQVGYGASRTGLQEGIVPP